MSIRVLIADDQALVRAGFRMILDAEDDLDVVGEASDGAEAVDAGRRLTPDVVLMDIRMPELDGIEATRRVVDAGGDAAGARARCSRRSTSTSTSTRRCAPARAASCSRTSRPSSSPPASASSRDGEALLAPSITRRLIEEFARAAPGAAAPPPGLAELTARELEVLQARRARALERRDRGRADRQRDDRQDPRRAVLMKLGLRDRVQAVVLAYESGVAVPGGAG